MLMIGPRSSLFMISRFCGHVILVSLGIFAIWKIIEIKSIRSRSILGGFGPFNVVTTIQTFGEESPSKPSPLWKKIKHGADGKMVNTNEPKRDVPWKNACKIDPERWAKEDKVLKESYDRNNPCDYLVGLVPKSQCKGEMYKSYYPNESPPLLPSLDHCPAKLAELVHQFTRELGSPLTSGDAENAMYASDDPAEELFTLRVQSSNTALFTDIRFNPANGTIEGDRLDKAIKTLGTVQYHFNLTDFDLTFEVSTIPICMRRHSPLRGNHTTNTGKNLRYLSMVRCAQTNMLPILEWNNANFGPFNEWDHRIELFMKSTQSVPWEERADKAIFHGALQDSTCDHFGFHKIPLESCHQQGRGHLVSLSETHSDVLDVEINSQPNGWNCTRQLTRRKTMEEIAKQYKYVIIAQTECGWTPELRTYLFSGSTILLQTTECKEYYQFLLEPWIHYVPWEPETLIDRIMWLRNNPDRAQEMAKNSIDFARTFLTKHAMTCWDALIYSHSALYSRQSSIKLMALGERIMTGFEGEEMRLFKQLVIEKRL